MTAVAHSLAKKSIVVKGEALQMVLNKKHGDYNESTSVFIGQLNPRCNEEDIVKELNNLL